MAYNGNQVTWGNVSPSLQEKIESMKVTVVDSLADSDPNKALSAKQGMELRDRQANAEAKLTTLEEEVEELKTTASSNEIEMGGYKYKPNYELVMDKKELAINNLLLSTDKYYYYKITTTTPPSIAVYRKDKITNEIVELMKEEATSPSPVQGASFVIQKNRSSNPTSLFLASAFDEFSCAVGISELQRVAASLGVNIDIDITTVAQVAGDVALYQTKTVSTFLAVKHNTNGEFLQYKILNLREVATAINPTWTNSIVPTAIRHIWATEDSIYGVYRAGVTQVFIVKIDKETLNVTGSAVVPISSENAVPLKLEIQKGSDGKDYLYYTTIGNVSDTFEYINLYSYNCETMKIIEDGTTMKGSKGMTSGNSNSQFMRGSLAPGLFPSYVAHAVNIGTTISASFIRFNIFNFDKGRVTGADYLVYKDVDMNIFSDALNILTNSFSKNIEIYAMKNSVNNSTSTVKYFLKPDITGYSQTKI